MPHVGLPLVTFTVNLPFENQLPKSPKNLMTVNKAIQKQRSLLWIAFAIIPLFLWTACSKTEPAKTNETQEQAEKQPSIAQQLSQAIETQSKPVESLDPSASLEETYNARYAQLVEWVNEFETEKVREKLDSLQIPLDTVHDYMFQGILYAWMSDFKKAALMLTEGASQLAQPPLDPILKNSNPSWKLSTETIMSPTFTVQDSKYLRSCYFTQRIADHIVRDCTSDEYKAEKLLDWVFRNVAYNEPEEANLTPLEIIMRGNGLCDRSAWVMATLAQRVGMNAEIVFLKADQKLRSSHTLCQLEISGHRLLCDTSNGTFLFFEAKPFGLTDIKDYLVAAQQGKEIPENFVHFTAATIGLAFEAEGVFPRLRNLDPYLKLMQPPGKAYVSLQDLYNAALETFPGDPEFAKKKVGIWDYPFFRMVHKLDPDSVNKWRASLQRVVNYEKARLLQVLGYYMAAFEEYKNCTTTCPLEYQEDLLYFSAQCFHETEQWEHADELFTRYVQNYPDGRWEDLVTYQLAQTKEALGDTSTALKLYSLVDHFQVAHANAVRIAKKLLKTEVKEAIQKNMKIEKEESTEK